MQFEIQKEALAAKLLDVNSIVEKNSPKAILSHIYLKAENNQLTLISTDTELTLTVYLPATVIESGTITVQSDAFTQLVNRLADGVVVNCQTKDEQFIIKAGKGNYKLQTLPADDFPIPESFNAENRVAIDAGDLTHLLTKVRFSMAENDPRHYLNGMYINPQNESNIIEAASTDGHRLSAASCNTNSAISGFEKGFIIPNKAVNALIKQISLDNLISELNLQKKAATDVETTNLLNEKIEQFNKVKRLSNRAQKNEMPRNLDLNLSERLLSLSGENWVLTTRLLEGKYPDYQRIFPEKQTMPILLDRMLLLDALRRLRVILNSKDEKALILRFEENKLSISARNSNSNDSGDEQIDIVNNQNIVCNVGINVLYLFDAANNISGDFLELHIQNPNSPVLITSQQDEQVRYVIMPMNID
ncbi:MAG: DNA polymerase III subunit beta [Cardiobacteriaceae bacterium]|nr:DNA polymerase III subunit beta [Cardiobacteriaceae bacterium]